MLLKIWKMAGNVVYQLFGLLHVIVIIINPANSHSFVGNEINRFTSSIIPTAPPHNGRQDLESVTTQERIASFGYPVEMHQVTTEDGYILTMHRIPYGRSSEFVTRKKPVLFQHGGFGDSFSWLFNHAHKNTALLLADLGYDIWIANARGTKYSRKHKYFSEFDCRFFDFSMDEIAKYDIPAQIDYILNTTGEAKLFFVGISLSPPEMHMTLSLLPEYNEKVSLFTSMAPTVFIQKTHPIAKVLNFFGDSTITKNILDFISGGTGEFPPKLNVKLSRIWGELAFLACQHPIFEGFCQRISYIIFGATKHTDEMNILPLAMAHAMNPISTRMADQYMQWAKTDRFQRYDFGATENLRIYGTAKPPLYNLNDTTAPVAVFYIERDSVVGPADVVRVVSELPNVVFFHRINSKTWDHIDFLIGHEVNERFNDHLIKLFEKY